MAATTTLLGLVTPTQGTLSGTWGDTVNYGISDYVDIAIAGTLTFTGDGAITLANTTGSASGNGFTTTTAQYMVIRITGTQTVTKVITGPSYSKLYMVDHAGATSAVTFKAAGQTGVTVAVGEKCFVYYNGTDYVKVASSVADGVTTLSFGSTGLTPSTATSGAVTVAGTLATANGGTNLTSFTSGGVVYASSSSALATGSALVFDGTKLGIGTSSPPYKLSVSDSGATGFEVGPGTTYVAGRVLLQSYNRSGSAYTAFDYSASEHKFQVSGSDAMVLTSTGLGIGTSSPAQKLHVSVGRIAVSNGYNIGSTDGNTGMFVGTNSVLFQTNANTVATFDASGNLGLGVTPTAWGSGYSVIQLKTNGSVWSNASVPATSIADNYYANASGADRYLANGYASQMLQQSGAFKWLTAGNNTGGTGVPITFTQAMTLDASGNLGIGTGSPSQVGPYASTLDVRGTAVDNNYGGSIRLASNNGTGSNITLRSVINSFIIDSAGTERARIDSSGNLLIGGTAARGTTAGTAHLDLFNGTAPAGTLTNGVSLYSSSGDLKFMNAAGEAFDVGYRNIPQNAQTGNYTLTLADSGDHIYHALGASAATYTIPANGSVAFPIGTAITFVNMAAANVTIAITTDTMYLSSAGTTGSRTLAQYGSATAIKLTSTTWLISGSGLT